MLSSALYARLRDAPTIQPLTRAAPDVIGVGGASVEIRGYVDAPIEIAGVTVQRLLLVVEGLAFPLLIGTDILRAHRAVFTLDETAPVRFRDRECVPSVASSGLTCLLLHPLPPSLRAQHAALSSSLARPHSFACELLTRCAKS